MVPPLILPPFGQLDADAGRMASIDSSCWSMRSCSVTARTIGAVLQSPPKHAASAASWVARPYIVKPSHWLFIASTEAFEPSKIPLVPSCPGAGRISHDSCACGHVDDRYATGDDRNWLPLSSNFVSVKNPC